LFSCVRSNKFGAPNKTKNPPLAGFDEVPSGLFHDPVFELTSASKPFRFAEMIFCFLVFAQTSLAHPIKTKNPPKADEVPSGFEPL
jgi:hypothetical protein